MRRLFVLVFGALLGAAAMFMAFKFHVVRTKDDWVFVPKPSASLVDPFVDVREWNSDDWTKHPQLLKALVLTGRSDLIRKSVTTRWKDKFFGERGAPNDDRKPDETSLDWPTAVERQ